MQFNIEFLQTTCLRASIYRLQKSKIESGSILLEGTRMVAEGVRTFNYAIGFLNLHDIVS
jgi:hypothetical protein